MQLETIYNPTTTEFNIVLEYLIKVEKTGNISTVEKCFNRNELIVVFDGKKLVGFSAYQADDIIAHIHIIEVIANYQKKGVGTKLADNTINQIIEKKALAIELFCSPSSSATFWSKIGFIKMPELAITNGRVLMYKPLVESLPAGNVESDAGETIELWNINEGRERDSQPKWKWNIPKTNFYIIQPCQSDWKISLSKGNNIVKACKVKYFSINSFFHGRYLILSETNLK
ncbi:hypothetical protein DNU06_10110 [Putridiphycobacter roseus]|uniref:N-acetyltransferase domain-containing protein n=1 Tax=Putridiphycobacter roseus TaxID=2219161 RepID=A0A2W1NQY8_9FLAO|nr:GNAT family N-acetyltransferase [Putridiphycobacter roseus]PZE17088.1 hypothetical protein DNU06_10110 [Putridiphycobacter roseus]